MEESHTPNTEQSTQHKSRAVLVAIIVVAVLAVAGVAALVIANPSSAPTTTQNEATGSTAETDANNAGSTAETATITYTDNGFTPATLTVKKGTKVTVVNSSSNPVQFSSDDHPTHRLDPEINMSELAPGENGSFTVTTVGTHGFHDHIDDSKTGTPIVTE